MTGYGEPPRANACSAIAAMTSRAATWPQSVPPCVTVGRPSGPSADLAQRSHLRQGVLLDANVVAHLQRPSQPRELATKRPLNQGLIESLAPRIQDLV